MTSRQRRRPPPSPAGPGRGAAQILLVLWLLQAAALAAAQQANSSAAGQNAGPSPHPQGLQSISNWLRLSPSPGPAAAGSSGSVRVAPPASGVAVEVGAPASNLLFQYQPVGAPRRPQAQQAALSSQTLVATASRGTKLELAEPSDADNAEPNDLFVSNTCERDFMLIRVRASRPFYGMIHTLNYRRKSRCGLEGDGGVEFQLNVSHALDSRDPAHCGVIMLRKQDSGEPGELLSVVIAIRPRKNVELSDDKFLVLNCTNRCRLPDCSAGKQAAGSPDEQRPLRQRQLEKEFDADVSAGHEQTNWWTRAAKRAQARSVAEGQTGPTTTCSVWRFPWLLALLCCLAILLAGSAISNCIICSSLAARPPADSKPGRPDQDRERRRGRLRDQYINYDNAEFHRPVDVAYLQAAARPRLESEQARAADGSQQRHKSAPGRTSRHR